MLNGRSVPAFALRHRPPEARIDYSGAPLWHRFDGADGQFYIGSFLLPDPLWIQPLMWEWRTGERFGRPNQSWLDVAFVDLQGRVGAISLKKDSATNLHFFLSDSLKISAASEVAPQAVRLWLEPEERRSQGNEEDAYNYWVLDVHDWGFVEAAEYEAACEFLKSGQFQWIIPAESGEVG